MKRSHGTSRRELEKRGSTSSVPNEAARLRKSIAERFRLDPVFERRGEELLSFPRFLGRIGSSFLMTGLLVVAALSVGILGYRYIAGLPWIDALLNASMILTGMGPVDSMQTRAAKIFASGYALFSGVVFLTSVGIVLAPVFHRVVHKFHLDESDSDENA